MVAFVQRMLKNMMLFRGNIMTDPVSDNRHALNRNTLKYIAAAAMILDHIAMYLMNAGDNAPLYAALRSIGRLTAPIMCFFLASGFQYTSSRKKYGQRLLIFALISQLPYMLAHYPHASLLDMNMIFTLFLSFVMLELYEHIGNDALKWTAVTAVIMLSAFGDWGIIAPIWVLMFYRYRDDRKKQLISYSVLCVLTVASDIYFCVSHHYHWYGELWQAGVFLAVPLFLLYDGRGGRKSGFSKWFFYILYPSHLAAIGLIRLLIN